MDRDTAVSRIQTKLGFRTDLVTEIQSALQDEQDELERSASLPWFLLQEDATFQITPANPATATPKEYNLPSGFIKEADERDGGQLRFQVSTPGPTQFIQKMDLKEAEMYFFNRRTPFWQDDVEIIVTEDTHFTPGSPLVYVLRKNVVRIYPGPDITYNLIWSYYTHDTGLTGANVTNQWLTYAPDLLVSGAGIRVADSTRDMDARAFFEGRREKALRSYLASIYERESADRNYAMGAQL